VSFDDGEQWLPLQLNLPTTSMRDLEVYEDDLIVATHGRGFWAIDDIAPLRQFDPALLSADAFLFKPSDAINYVATSDNGTPLQKDEPQAANPPNGVAIDYWLRAAAAGPVTLEIADSTGAVVRAYGTNAPPTPAAGGRGGSGGIPNTSPLWRPAPEPFATSAGMHRVVWNPVSAPAGRGGGGGGGGGGGFGRGGVPLFGTFTARLTVGGRSYTQSFTVKPDPRSVDAK